MRRWGTPGPPTETSDIWIAGNGQPYRPVALLSGKMLIGNVTELKLCIDAAKNKADSFYDNPYIRVLANRLPKGIVVDVHRTIRILRRELRRACCLWKVIQQGEE